MNDYIIAILILGFILGCWAAFQLWTGRQADGTPIDAETRSCPARKKS
jgi:hypothetical protein